MTKTKTILKIENDTAGGIYESKAYNGKLETLSQRRKEERHPPK